MKIQIPGIDIEKGLDLYDDEEDIYLQVLRSYASNTPAVINKLRNVSAETLSAETLPDYAAAVHGIKGTSANIGAEVLREKAKHLEALAKAGDLSGVLSLNADLIKTADALLAGIQNWLKQYNN